MHKHGASIGVAGTVFMLAVLGTAWSSRAGTSAVPATTPTRVSALLDTYCVTCHNERTRIGNLALDGLDLTHVGGNAETWEKVLRKLRADQMPPDGAPRPDAAARQAIVSWLETAIDRDAAASPNPGRTVVHRLNRVEYANAVRDLLALEIDPRSLLPADNSGFGFDNIADVLAMTPGLLERYLFAAETISRLAVGDPNIRPDVAMYKLPYLRLLQNDRMSDDLPAASRGGMVVRHNFPLDAEYVIQVRLQRHAAPLGSLIRGLDEENEIDVRLDGIRLRVFPIGGMTAGATPGTPAVERTSNVDGDELLEVRVPVRAGLHTVGVALQKRTWMPEGIGPSRLPVTSFGYAAVLNANGDGGRVETAVDHIEITGPFRPAGASVSASRRKIFVCSPRGPSDEASCARRIIATLVRHAYRRPVHDTDVQEVFGAYAVARRTGNFDAGIQAVVKRVLSDPEFLFRIERQPATVANAGIYRISDLELASRLSFFLWSSIPDEELLDIATRGRLHEPSVLEQQVRRLLADGRSQAFLTNFFGQWLYLRNIAIVQPDPRSFPQFDENLRRAFQRESELFIESQVRNDRSAEELLTANYTFVNERLARHYGIPNVYGSHFRRVTYPDDRRAGLLGQGSILTVTSYANRTSPVKRGQWILENLLASPPPPPPPNVPPFPENSGDQGKSVRERMEQHRKNPTCAVCHSKLDPLGFALENFDGIGRWRTTDANIPIDPSGAFPDGTRFDSPVAFRSALMTHRDEFLLALTEKLLTYAMGRGAEYYDMPAIRGILRESASADYRWSAIILNVVKSVPFQMRRAA